jgi:hypothetical protein
VSLSKADHEVVAGIVAESIVAALPSIVAALRAVEPAVAAPTTKSSSDFMSAMHGPRHPCSAGCGMAPMLSPERASHCVAPGAKAPKGVKYHRTV